MEVYPFQKSILLEKSNLFVIIQSILQSTKLKKFKLKKTT
jgi:hypothetical protein